MTTHDEFWDCPSCQPTVYYPELSALFTRRLGQDTLKRRLDQLADVPNMIRNTKLHGRRHANSFVDTAQIVMRH